MKKSWNKQFSKPQANFYESILKETMVDFAAAAAAIGGQTKKNS